MKILIIGSSKSKESKSIKEAALKRDHQAEVIPLSHLVFGGQKELEIKKIDGQNIDSFDAVIFRAISRHVVEANIVAKYLKEKGKKVIDSGLFNQTYQYHKFLMHTRLWQDQVPQPPTYFPLKKASLNKITEEIEPPFIVKHIKEMRGRSVFRFDSKEEVINFFNKKGLIGNYLIQKWYPSKKYFRTIVLGNQVLGAIERLSLKCKNRPHIPLSERSKKTNLTPELEEISIKAAKATSIDFGGLDIMPDEDNNLRIIEINRSPQFRRFTKETNVNVADKIIDFL